MALQPRRFTLYKEPSFEDPVSQSSWDGGPSVGSGSDMCSASLLFEFLQGACRLKINDHLSAVPRWGRRPRDVEDPTYPWESLISALNGFLSAAWWTRDWTIQESVVGKEPIFFYRTAAAPWAMILEAVNTLQAHVSDCCTPYLRNGAPPGYAQTVLALIKQVQDIRRARDAYRSLCSPQPDVRVLQAVLGPRATSHSVQATSFGLAFQALLQHLQTYRVRQATDPRDKVYALLPLVRRTPSVIINLDYEDTTEVAYMMAAKAIITASGSLDALAAARILPPSPTNLTLPSWCPDWSATSTFYPSSVSQLHSLQWYNASPGTTPKVSFPKDEPCHLNTEGMLVDTVATLSEDLGINEDDRALWNRLFSWLSLSPTAKWIDFCRAIRADVWTREGYHSFYRMGKELQHGSIQERLWKDPATGELRSDLPRQQQVGDSASAEEAEKSFREWDCVISTQAARMDLQSGPATPPLEEQLRTSTECRRFMVTFQGRLGLVPPATEVGDALVILKGCHFPCVLRPTCSGSNIYCLVGSAYVHGLMDGEVYDIKPALSWDAMTLR